MAVSFHTADIVFTLPAKLILKKFIAVSFEAEAHKKLYATYIFCSDEYLLKINQDFLQHDFYTDIITFPLSETDKKVEAEIYVSIDRIRDNATKLNMPFETELHRVIFHGALHLAGYKDKKTLQKKQMKEAEDRWIARLYTSYKNNQNT